MYRRDAFNDAVLAQDAFGMISGFPLDGYVKAGRFRSPYGLRMDDHTVATREGFLNLTTVYDRDAATGAHPAVHSRRFGLLGQPVYAHYTGACQPK